MQNTTWHGLINYIDTEANCHLKKFTCKGTFAAGLLSEFIDWRYSQSCWHFRPSFVNCCLSNLLSGSTLHTSRLPCVKVQYIQTICGWEEVHGGVLSPVTDHILQEFNILYMTRFRTYKTARPPQTKA